MRTAALPKFRKLYGKIDNDLPKGDYEFDVLNVYDVAKFKGKKSIIVSNANAFGGKNSFLAISFIILGFICLFITIGFTIKLYMHEKKKRTLKQ